MQFGEQLVADSRFTRSVREQRRVEERNERLGHRFDAPIRRSDQNRSEDGSWLNRRIEAGFRSTDRQIDLLDELSGERDSDRDTVSIINASYRALHNPAEMKRKPVGSLGRPDGVAYRVEVVTEITKL